MSIVGKMKIYDSASNYPNNHILIIEARLLSLIDEL